MTELATEMPRCFSISIQSEVACRALLRAFPVPAMWIAPEKSSSFSVSVVLPASGWEMIAKVLRRATSDAICGWLIDCTTALNRPRILPKAGAQTALNEAPGGYSFCLARKPRSGLEKAPRRSRRRRAYRPALPGRRVLRRGDQPFRRRGPGPRRIDHPGGHRAALGKHLAPPARQGLRPRRAVPGRAADAARCRRHAAEIHGRQPARRENLQA